ncbi:hypothetical protein C8R44DRAFT_849415 [Mycena epipterygia]|nr:hypothetical protein C8R44DRAFT_849415 [Mycena epipterygia]
MPFFLHALLLLALASFAPQASAVIVVVHHSGLSDTTRIVIIVVAIVLFLLLCACRLARIRQNRIARESAIAALPSVAVPVGTMQMAPNYASQGAGGYNGYTLPPPGPGQYPPPQGYPFPNQPQNYIVPPGQGQPQNYAPQGYTPPAYAPDAEKGYGTPPANATPTFPARQPANEYAHAPPGVYAPPPGPPGVYAPPPGPPSAYSPPPGVYSPPPGPPPTAAVTGYDAAPITPPAPVHVSN